MFTTRQDDWEEEPRIPSSIPSTASFTPSPYIRTKPPRLAKDPEDQYRHRQAACTHCRLRKIRCDRLQPQCSNCCKDGVECHTSTAFTRTNDVKELYLPL